MHWRIRDGQKVSIFCVCGGALSLVGRNNKSAGKGSTNVQRSKNTNTNENTHKNCKGSTNIQRSENTNTNENTHRNTDTRCYPLTILNE